ncbi:MAG: PAS domain-containing protein [Halococcoides sp.]
MTVPPLDDALVGLVSETTDGAIGYRSVCESIAAGTVTVPATRAALESTDADLLVVEGAATLAAQKAAGDHPPTMFVDRDPVTATRAMGAGADVFLHADRPEQFADRLRSLHRGATVDARSTSDDRIGGSVETSAYATLMEEFDDHIYVFDRHGRFVRVNQAKAAFHDTTPDALVGKSEFDIFFPETAVEIYADNMAVLEGRQEVRNETEWVENAAGERVHVTVAKHPITDSEGRIIGLIGISRDVTALSRRQTLVDAVARVIEHLYGIYDHNFRNLIQTRIGIQATLRDAIDVEAAGRDHLVHLREAIEDGATVVDADDATHPDADDAIEHADRAIDDWDRIVEAIDSAGEAERELVDALEALVRDFGDLVSAVRTDGEIREFDVVEMADRPGSWSVTGPSVVVRTDDRAARLFFEQLAHVVPTGATASVTPTAEGFELDLPARVTMPAIAGQYRDQDLLSGSTPLLKASVLAEVMGWEIETRRPESDRTVLAVDTAAWTRWAGAE